jgi:predicted GTPase
MGYSAIQRHELEETINRVPADLVLVATPVDLGAILRLNKPCVRVSYEIEELTRPSLAEVLAEFTARYEHRLESTRAAV